MSNMGRDVGTAGSPAAFVAIRARTRSVFGPVDWSPRVSRTAGFAQSSGSGFGGESGRSPESAGSHVECRGGKEKKSASDHDAGSIHRPRPPRA